ncbi:MAG: 30S ribosomal protein S7 [Candidatus Berkelbacteria bacterium]|nr:30S ribosomal protein S7 [Candidatus Berkelbacteria bacterium]
MRGKSGYKRKTIEPDKRFVSSALAKFINYVMERGKKSVAEKIVYSSLDEASAKLKKEPLDIFNQVIIAVAPSVEVRSRRIGGANYQIPMEVKEPRRTALAMRWIIEGAKSKKGLPMAKKLAEEYCEILSGASYSLKKRADTHKMAEANRAFAHFARLR